MIWTRTQAGLYHSDNGWWIEHCRSVKVEDMHMDAGWCASPPLDGHGLAHGPYKTLRDAKAWAAQREDA